MFSVLFTGINEKEQYDEMHVNLLWLRLAWQYLPLTYVCIFTGSMCIICNYR